MSVTLPECLDLFESPAPAGWVPRPGENVLVCWDLPGGPVVTLEFAVDCFWPLAKVVPLAGGRRVSLRAVRPVPGRQAA